MLVPFNTLYEQVQRIEQAESHEDQLFLILKTYMEHYPVLNATLSRYSSLGFLGEGIISIDMKALEYISEMRDDIRSIPIVYSAIQERRSKICKGIDCLKMTSSKYQIASNVQAISVTPISYGTFVFGFICSTLFEPKQPLNDGLLDSFTQFGKLVGQIMAGTAFIHNGMKLSKREIEVMRRVSWGESAKEMAATMKISEFTINQYVKSSLKKLGANNRAQAVGILLREGIIT